MVDKKDNKYGDMEELLGSVDSAASVVPSGRRKRPLSPALGAVTGNTKPTRILDEVTAKKINWKSNCLRNERKTVKKGRA